MFTNTLNGEKLRIGDASASHLYNVEVEKDSKTGEIHVDANNRGEANRLAKKAGFITRSVNMIG